MAGTLLFHEKIRHMLCFGLDCGMLEVFTHTSRNPKKNTAFLNHGSPEKMADWAHANRDPNKQELDSFLHEAAQNFELLSNIQDQK